MRKRSSCGGAERIADETSEVQTRNARQPAAQPASGAGWSNTRARKGADAAGDSFGLVEKCALVAAPFRRCTANRATCRCKGNHWHVQSNGTSQGMPDAPGWGLSHAAQVLAPDLFTSVQIEQGHSPAAQKQRAVVGPSGRGSERA